MNALREQKLVVFGVAVGLLFSLALASTETALAQSVKTARSSWVPRQGGANIAPEFKTYFVNERATGGRWQLKKVVILFARNARGSQISVTCHGCGIRFEQGWRWRRHHHEDFRVTHSVISRRSRLVISVVRPGFLGRYKIYSLRPKGRSNRLLREGCLAPDGFRHVRCAPLNWRLVGPGALFTPACPSSPCTVLSRVSAYQDTAGGLGGVSRVKAAGFLVGWEIALGRPSSHDIAYFDAHEGGRATAEISVLRRTASTSFSYELVGRSEPVELQSHFGTVAYFTLEPALRVTTGEVIALTVPTWAPALATIGFSSGNEETWRSSRQEGQCNDFFEASQTQLESSLEYFCSYEESELTYDGIVRARP